MTVVVMLLTYSPAIEHPRARYAYRTLTRALTHLKTKEELRFHLADDGSVPEHLDGLVDLVRTAGYPVSTTNAQRGGYGKSYNLATQYCHSLGEYFLPLEDDWELTRDLDLDNLIKAVAESHGTPQQFDCIRMGYLGWTNDLKGRLISSAGQHFLMFNPDSDETHVWAGHPRLETLEFQRLLGPWPEGIDPGSTEFTVANRRNSRYGVVWPLDLVKPWGDLWSHIGTVKARTDQDA